MTTQQAIDDLNYATNLAKAGQEAPLVGGPIGLMWGVLLSITLSLHWAIVSGVLSLDLKYLWILWISFSMVGAGGSALFGRAIEKKPSINSTANQVEQSVWIMFAIMLGCFWVGITISMLIGAGTPILFDFVAIAGFGGQGLAYGVTARISHHSWLAYPSAAAFIASVVCFCFFGQPLLYLIAAVATVFTVILTSIKTMRYENAA